MTPPTSTIASGALRKLLAVAADAGLPADAMLAALGLPPGTLDDPDGRIRIATLHAAWDLLLTRGMIGDGAITAQRYAPGDYGLVGFVAMSSATLGEALSHVVRYVGLWTDDPQMTLDERGTVGIAYRQSFADSPGMRAATEAAPAEIIHGARLLSHAHVVPREVRFAHSAPRYAAEYERFFGCEVRFDAADHALVFEPSDLALALPRADAQLGAFLRAKANDALEKRRGEEEGTALSRVREIIAEELQTGVPSIEQVARRIAMSERTLRRRLEERGTSFRDVLDDTRAGLARSYVRDRAMPLSEVAFMLGFAEPSTFHRAFKRWTNTTPATFRKSG